VLKKYPKEVKLVNKNYPLSRHKFARRAATAALAAYRQGKFWEFHEKLFENMKKLNEAKIQEIAKELELDMERFSQDMKDSAIQNIIVRDLREGRKAKVRGTPTVFINGKLVQQRNLRGFQRMIEDELQKMK
jgi:protein-disulfide isomerase